MKVIIEIEYNGDMKPEKLKPYIGRKLDGLGDLTIKIGEDKQKKKKSKKGKDAVAGPAQHASPLAPDETALDG